MLDLFIFFNVYQETCSQKLHYIAHHCLSIFRQQTDNILTRCQQMNLSVLRELSAYVLMLSMNQSIN